MTSYYGGKKSNGHLIPQDLETAGAKKAAHAIINAVHFVQDPNVNIPNNRKADIVNLAKNAIQTIENVDHIAPNGNFTDQIIHDQVIDRVHENIVSAIQREIAPPVLNNAVITPPPDAKQQLGISAREVELDRQLAISRNELHQKESQLNISNQAISDYMKYDRQNIKRLKRLTYQKKTLEAQYAQAKQNIVTLEGEKQALAAQLNIISAERAQVIQERDALSVRLNGDAVTVGVLQQLQNALVELTKVKKSESQLQQDLTQLTAQEQQNQAQIATLDAQVKRLIANEQKLTQDLADAQKILQTDMPILKQNLQDEQEKLTKKIKEFVALQAENKKIESSKKKVDKRLTTARAQVQQLTQSLTATQTQLTASLSEKAKAEAAQQIAEQQSQKDQLAAAEAKLKQTIAERATQAAQHSEALEKKAREAAEQSEAAEKKMREAAERVAQQLNQQVTQHQQQIADLEQKIKDQTGQIAQLTKDLSDQQAAQLAQQQQAAQLAQQQANQTLQIAELEQKIADLKTDQQQTIQQLTQAQQQNVQQQATQKLINDELTKAREDLDAAQKAKITADNEKQQIEQDLIKAKNDLQAAQKDVADAQNAEGLAKQATQQAKQAAQLAQQATRQAEQEKNKAEQATQQAEQEKQKAEQAAQLAQQAEQQAEQEKNKAQQAAQKLIASSKASEAKAKADLLTEKKTAAQLAQQAMQQAAQFAQQATQQAAQAAQAAQQAEQEKQKAVLQAEQALQLAHQLAIAQVESEKQAIQQALTTSQANLQKASADQLTAESARQAAETLHAEIKSKLEISLNLSQSYKKELNKTKTHHTKASKKIALLLKQEKKHTLEIAQLQAQLQQQNLQIAASRQAEQDAGLARAKAEAATSAAEAQILEIKEKHDIEQKEKIAALQENARLTQQYLTDQVTIQQAQDNTFARVISEFKDIDVATIDSAEKLQIFIDTANANNEILKKLSQQSAADAQILNERIIKLSSGDILYYDPMSGQDIKYDDYKKIKEQYDELKQKYSATEIKGKYFLNQENNDKSLLDILNDYHLNLKQSEIGALDNTLKDIHERINAFENVYDTMQRDINQIKQNSYMPELQGPMFTKLFTQINQQIEALNARRNVKELYVKYHNIQFNSDNPFYDNPDIKQNDLTFAPALITAYFSHNLEKMRDKVMFDQKELIENFKALNDTIEENATAKTSDGSEIKENAALDTAVKFIEFRNQFLNLENQATDTLSQVIQELHQEIKNYTATIKTLTPSEPMVNLNPITEILNEHIEQPNATQNITQNATQNVTQNAAPTDELEMMSEIIEDQQLDPNITGLRQNISIATNPAYQTSKDSVLPYNFMSKTDGMNGMHGMDDIDIGEIKIQPDLHMKKLKHKNFETDPQIVEMCTVLKEIGKSLGIQYSNFSTKHDVSVLSEQIKSAIVIKEAEHVKILNELEATRKKLIEVQKQNAEIPEMRKQLAVLSETIKQQKKQLDEQAQRLAKPIYQIEQAKRPEDREFNGNEHAIIAQLKVENIELKAQLSAQIANLNIELEHVKKQLTAQNQLRTMQLSDEDKKYIDIQLSDIKNAIVEYIKQNPQTQGTLDQFLDKINEKIKVDSALVMAHIEEQAKQQTLDKIKEEFNQYIDIKAAHNEWKKQIVEIVAERKEFNADRASLIKKYENDKLALQKTIDEKDNENIKLLENLIKAEEETQQLLDIYDQLTSTIKKNLTYEDKKQLSHEAQDKKDVTLIKEYLAFLIKNKDIISQDKQKLEEKLKQAERNIITANEEKRQLNQKYIDLEAAIVDQYPDFKSQVPAVGKIQLALTASSSKVILTAREQQLQDILSGMQNLQKLLYPDEGNQKNEQLIQDQVDNMLGYIQKVIERQNNPPVTGGRQYNQMFYKPTITNQIFDSSYMSCNFEFMFIITLLIVLSVYLLYLVYHHGRPKRIYQGHQGSQSQPESRQSQPESRQIQQSRPESRTKNNPIIQHPYATN